MTSLENRLKQHAHILGFELVGIAPANPADTFDHLSQWLDQGHAGEMEYMSRHAEARRHPASILADVKSVVMVGLNYAKPETRNQKLETSDAEARVAAYARGHDYHDVLREKLKELLAWVRQEVPGCRGRCVVDTAPLLERDFARRAGLGWFGKNTMLINKRLGSYFFLGALLLDIELQADPVHEASHCGTCTACLDACPTDAFVAPGQLDSRRCISYLTIELRGPIDEKLRPGLGNWLFGCDICQDVCPWNRKSPVSDEPAWEARPDLEALDPQELLQLSEEDFRRRFRGTALWRAGRRGLLRNAAIILGNTGNESALAVLERAMRDVDPVIRDAAQWAIHQIASRCIINNGSTSSFRMRITMGRVAIPVTIESIEDLYRVQRGEMSDKDVRRVNVPDALIDTGATSLSLPRRMIQQLGLLPIGKRRAITSGGIQEVPTYGAVKLTVDGRDCVCDVSELADECPALIGQVPLDLMDFVVDPVQKRLMGNPAHGGEHLIELL